MLPSLLRHTLAFGAILTLFGCAATGPSPLGQASAAHEESEPATATASTVILDEDFDHPILGHARLRHYGDCPTAKVTMDADGRNFTLAFDGVETSYAPSELHPYPPPGQLLADDLCHIDLVFWDYSRHSITITGVGASGAETLSDGDDGDYSAFAEVDTRTDPFDTDHYPQEFFKDVKFDAPSAGDFVFDEPADLDWTRCERPGAADNTQTITLSSRMDLRRAAPAAEETPPTTTKLQTRELHFVIDWTSCR
jgi:hypothetical protein